MTILPKKNTTKEKNEGDNSDHPPRSPTGDSLGHVSRRPPSPPPRWNSPSPRDDRLSAHDPGGRYEEATSGYKRRHRSSPHRTSRKHRHERHERYERSAWDGASVARPRGPKATQHMPLDMVPSTSSEQETIEEDHNSEDEYAAPVVPENINELEEWFEKTLKEKRGFIIKPMANDGACMFRSVADQVYGDQEMHHVVRKLCIDYMTKNQDFFSQYVTEDFSLYLARKTQPSCHGNHIEMQVMCEIFNRPIEVYQYRVDPINTFSSMYKTDNDPIRVSYHGNVHYNSVVDPYRATVGVGLGLPGFQPGLAEKNLMSDAKKVSEEHHIEQTMLEDKMRETDWEVTQETINEQVARESYLQWLKDKEKGSKTPPTTSVRSASATCSSAAAASGASAAAAWWSPSSTPPPSSSPPPPPRSPAVAGCSSSSPLRPAVNDGAVAGSSRSPQPSASAPAVPDFNPQLFGFGVGDWDEDDIMAQVMAASQEEYLNSLKNKMSPTRSEHSPPPPPPPPPSSGNS